MSAKKLTQRSVNEIREEYAAGGVRLVDLAAKHGVSFQLISQVVNRKIWNGKDRS